MLQAELPDLSTVAPDLVVPAVSNAAPAAGKRVRGCLPGFTGGTIHHVLYLPADWAPGRRFPIIAELAGNGPWSNRFGDKSDGTPEGSSMGYGISGGSGYLWICLPYVDPVGRSNVGWWWGDAASTARYAREAVAMLCRDFGGDADRVLLAGFSRGSIGVSYIGLRDDATADTWRAFLCHSHFDGLQKWPYEGWEKEAALSRLARLRGRPVMASGETVRSVRGFAASNEISGVFSYLPVPFRNHSDGWVLRPILERETLRAWVRKSLDLP